MVRRAPSNPRDWRFETPLGGCVGVIYVCLKKNKNWNNISLQSIETFTNQLKHRK